MAVLTPEQVGAYWILAGAAEGEEDKARRDTATAISEAYVESNFDTEAKSSVGALGLWQLHPEGTTDPFENARGAIRKWKDGGYSFRKHWTAFQASGTEAKRLAYMPKAIRAANKIKRDSLVALGQIADVAGSPGGVGPKGDKQGFDIPNPLDGIEAVASAIRNIGEALLGLLKIQLEVLTKIMDPNTWLDGLKIMAGLILVFMGLRRLLKVST